MRPRRLLLACLLLGLLSSLQARELLLGVGPRLQAGDSAPGFGVRLALFDLRSGDHDFELGMRLGLSAAGLGLDAAGGWRRSWTAGPLGNLVLEARAGLDAAGAGGLVGARGVLGPVALRLELDLGQRGPAPFAVLARGAPAAPTGDLRRLSGAPDRSFTAGLQLAASWRIDRSWWLEAQPRLAWTQSGWAFAGQASLRRSALWPDLDLSLQLEAAGARAGERHAAIGLTLHHVPRRAPESRVTAWWGRRDPGPGAGAAWSRPGFELSTTVREGSVSTSLAAGWAAFRADRPAAYLVLGSSGPLASGRWLLNGRWGQGEGGSLELAWSRSF